jgi:sugar lactone lactonase YvrE
MNSNGKTAGTLFLLDPNHGYILRCDADGKNVEILVRDRGDTPDGITLDVARGHIYWTNMGADPKADSGYIERANLDGANVITVVPRGFTHTPKQLKFSAADQRLYWSDREGMRVMRANLDGTNVETLVVAGTSEEDRLNPTKWCVGMAVDTTTGWIYWTQKGGDNAGQGRIFRAHIDIPVGQSPQNRNDIEVLYSDLPEPIDLDIDFAKRRLYWSDRGAPPTGNSVNFGALEPSQGATRQVLATGMHEAIGLALDRQERRLFVSDLSGCLYRMNMDGTDFQQLISGQGHLTGIVYTDEL